MKREEEEKEVREAGRGVEEEVEEEKEETIMR